MYLCKNYRNTVVLFGKGNKCYKIRKYRWDLHNLNNSIAVFETNKPNQSKKPTLPKQTKTKKQTETKPTNQKIKKNSQLV